MAADLTALQRLGWTPEHAAAFDELATDPLFVPGRVVVDFGSVYLVQTPTGEQHAELAGKLRLSIRRGEAKRPAVGDWLILQEAPGQSNWVIHNILPRKTVLTRKAAGRGSADQVVGANIDIAFVVSSVGTDLNARRLERYLTVVHEGGAKPVLLLSKSDLSATWQSQVAELAPIIGSTPIHAISIKSGLGLAEVEAYLQPGVTLALIGSSGVGKSSLINRWAGADLRVTGALRDDGRGRHTTTHRELMVLAGGAIIIDTPGMRELGLSDAHAGLDDAFADVVALAQGCRFADCGHSNEPGCAVNQALKDGVLAPDRLEAFRTLKREIAHQDARKREAEGRRDQRPRTKPRHGRG